MTMERGDVDSHDFDIAGRTISKLTRMRLPQYDDDAWLKMDFTDGTTCYFIASQGSYSRDAQDEYVCTIQIAMEEPVEGLVPCDS